MVVRVDSNNTLGCMRYKILCNRRSCNNRMIILNRLVVICSLLRCLLNHVKWLEVRISQLLFLISNNLCWKRITRKCWKSVNKICRIRTRRIPRIIVIRRWMSKDSIHQSCISTITTLKRISSSNKSRWDNSRDRWVMSKTIS